MKKYVGKISGEIALNKGNEPHRLNALFNNIATLAAQTLQHLLIVPYRQHHNAAFIQLRNQRSRNFRRRGGDDDARPSQTAPPPTPLG